MSAIGRAAQGWVRLWDLREPPLALALVRIGIALVFLWDFATVLRFQLVSAIWAPIEDGGIGPATHAVPVSIVYEWLGASAGSARLVFGVACASAVTLLLGLFTRTSALLLVLSYAQLAQLSPEADRGIDTLLRNVLLILACSAAGATLSLDARLFRGRFVRDDPQPAWPRYLIVLQLVVLYFWAGMLKQSVPWTSLDRYSALFIVMSQPHYATFALPPALMAVIAPLLQLSTIGTLVFERGSIFLPLMLWLRATRARGGRLRDFVNRARLLEVWVSLGVIFHLGLAVGLELGIFPWGCLALYPALASPYTLARWWERARGYLAARRTGTSKVAPLPGVDAE